MEQLIADYIKEYLFDNQNLSIKGLGEFITEFIPAEIDDAMKVIEPARKKLKFTENAEYTTPAFLEFMAEKNNFSISAAEPYMSRFVNTIKDAIDNNQPIGLRGLGKFEPGLLSGMRFTPDEGTNFLRSTQSLDAVDLPNYNADSPTVSQQVDEKSSVADVLVGDLSSFKDLHNRAFNKNNGAKEEESVIPKKEVNEELANKTEVIEKKTVSEVLSENAKAIDPTNDYDSMVEEKVAHNPINPDELEEEEGGRSMWLLFFPFLIFLLLALMLGQIAFSDKAINESPPFSWFMSGSGDSDGSDEEMINQSKKDEEKLENAISEDAITKSENSDNTSTSDTDLEYSEPDNQQASSESDTKKNTSSKNSDTTSKPSKNTGASSGSNSSSSKTTSSGSSSNSATATGSTRNTSSSNNSSISQVLSSNPQKGFYIVTGAFGEGGNALKRHNAIRNAGFEPVVIKNKKGLYQCMVFAPNGQIEARKMLSNVRNKFSKDAWIFHNK